MFSHFAIYPTFLVFIAFIVAMLFTMALMPGFIHLLQRKNIGQQVRDDGPQTHLVKQGTPTMGGVVMLLAIVISVLLIGLLDPETYLLLGALVCAGILGAIDDGSKIAHERSLGLTPTMKLIFQFGIAAAFILFAVNMLGIAPTVDIPFICNIDMGILTTVIPIGNDVSISIPWIYLVFCMVLIVGMCNAVNLTDGLDGLAAGSVMVVMIVMAAISFADNALEPSIFSSAIAGACVGFLWFNSHPADIFMGDTGSLALGMALGCLSVLTKTEFIVIIIGALFVAEALSVMIQVFYFKRTGKRIFLMAPLHHHFEKKGWSETKVVVRFWILAGSLAAFGFFIWFADNMSSVI